MKEYKTPMDAVDFFEFVELCINTVALAAYDSSHVADLKPLCGLPLGELSEASQYIVDFYAPMAKDDTTEKQEDAFDWDELEKLLAALRLRSGSVLAELVLLQNDARPEDGDILDDLACRDLGTIAHECSRLYFEGINRDVERAKASEAN